MNDTVAAGGPDWWLLDFYNDRSGLLARVRVQARLPATAVDLGRQQLLAAHPPGSGRRRRSLFGQAQLDHRLADGWALYRIVNER